MSNNTRVEGKRIESIYNDFLDKKLEVNRRYQRKLVWSLEQKQALIDSVMKSLPIPLILLAQSKTPNEKMEIVDGLQRLEALIAFMENRFPYKGTAEKDDELSGLYFNLESIATTKHLLDEGILVQQEPKMSREDSLRIANYELPISTYEAAKSADIDETFRRINSTGRKLSRQEVRQAGSVTKIAETVRKISAEIRGDATSLDIINLASMRKYSLTWKNHNDEEGILVDEIFWVRHGVINRDDLRSSFDEQLVLDLLLDVLLNFEHKISSSTRDAAYKDGEISRALSRALKVTNQDKLIRQFVEINDIIENIVRNYSTETQWRGHIGKSSKNPTSSYYHVAFIAFYTLLFNERKVISDSEKLAGATRDYWKNNTIRDGGTWTVSSRKKEVDKFIGAIRGCFIEDSSPEANFDKQQIERLKRELLKYSAETQFYELKTGLRNYSLDSSKGRIQEARTFFKKILKTATAMANTAPNAEGVIYIGIADNYDTVRRIEEKVGIEPFGLNVPHLSESSSFIMGIDHELEFFDISLDDYVETMRRWILEDDQIDSEQFKRDLANSLDPITLYSDTGHRRTVIAIYPSSIDMPVAFGDSSYERVGSSNRKLSQSELFRRYDEFRFRSNDAG